MISKKTDLNRRQFVDLAASSFLGVSSGSVLAAKAGQPNNPRIGPAKQMIYLFMGGGMSHIDTFEY